MFYARHYSLYYDVVIGEVFVEAFFSSNCCHTSFLRNLSERVTLYSVIELCEHVFLRNIANIKSLANITRTHFFKTF